MAHAIAIAAKSAAAAAQQENDQDDDEYRSKRHGALPETLPAASRTPRGPEQRTFPAASPRSARQGDSARRTATAPPPSLRAQRSNPCPLQKETMDCFAALAKTSYFGC